jgi:hypothetical protein
MQPLIPLSVAHELAEAPSLSAYLDNLRSDHAKPMAPQRFDRGKLAYQHPDLGDDPRPDPHGNADVALAKRIGECLHLHYPGHAWLVEVEHAQGIARVSIPHLMGSVACYVIHLGKLAVDPRMDIVCRAGGEILERYQLPRNRFDYWQFAEACRKVDIRAQRKGTVPE